VRPPAQQARTVTEAPAREMVVANLDHELRLERLPLAGALRRPAARTTRRVAGESRGRDQNLQFFGERRLVLALDRGGEADVMQQPVLIVEAKQQRADKGAAFVVAKAADHAVGAAVVLDLLHAAAVARAVRKIAPFGDDAV